MDIDSFLVDLPPDPTAALVELFDRLDDYTDELAQRRGDDPDHEIRISIKILDAWFQKHDLSSYAYQGEMGWSDWKELVDTFRYEALSETIEAKVELAASGDLMKFGYAKLDQTEKQEIHAKLNHIRQIVDGSSLSDRKKTAILNKLTALSKEVDKNGTQIDQWMGLWPTVGLAIGEFAENAKPAIEDAKDIARIIFRAQARNEGVALPPPDEFKLLD